jgi:hypothetical protein
MLVLKSVQLLNHIIARTQQQLAREAALGGGGNMPPASGDKSLKALIHKGGYDSDEDADLMLHDDDYAHVLHDLKVCRQDTAWGLVD